jgi:uncharacterized protein
LPSAGQRATSRGTGRSCSFLGLEGATWSRGSVYFVASEAGNAEKGQIWRYTPGRRHGRLTLLYESRSENVLDEPDALVVSPRGGVVVCEDGDGDDQGGTNYLRRALGVVGCVLLAGRHLAVRAHPVPRQDVRQHGAVGARMALTVSSR